MRLPTKACLAFTLSGIVLAGCTSQYNVNKHVLEKARDLAREHSGEDGYTVFFPAQDLKGRPVFLNAERIVDWESTDLPETHLVRFAEPNDTFRVLGSCLLPVALGVGYLGVTKAKQGGLFSSQAIRQGVVGASILSVGVGMGFVSLLLIGGGGGLEPTENKELELYNSTPAHKPKSSRRVELVFKVQF